MNRPDWVDRVLSARNHDLPEPKIYHERHKVSYTGKVQVDTRTLV